MHTSASGPCPWGSVSCGSGFCYLVCSRETWRRRRLQGAVGGGSWGPRRWLGVSKGSRLRARGERRRVQRREPPQASPCASVPLYSRAVSGRPSVLLLPVRKESAAADTRREYVRVRPLWGLQAGPRSFPLSDVCPCPGLPFSASSWQVSSCPWRADCNGLHSAGRIGHLVP